MTLAIQPRKWSKWALSTKRTPRPLLLQGAFTTTGDEEEWEKNVATSSTEETSTDGTMRRHSCTLTAILR